MNPFDAFGIDPSLSPNAITAAFRARMEAARTEAERDALREAWESLVRHPRERVVLALLAAPERTPPAGKAPPKRRIRAAAATAEVALDLQDFLFVPGLADGLPAPDDGDDSIDEDPLIGERAQAAGRTREV